jgi:hypothetical protein
MMSPVYTEGRLAPAGFVEMRACIVLFSEAEAHGPGKKRGQATLPNLRDSPP